MTNLYSKVSQTSRTITSVLALRSPSAAPSYADRTTNRLKYLGSPERRDSAVLSTCPPRSLDHWLSFRIPWAHKLSSLPTPTSPHSRGLTFSFPPILRRPNFGRAKFLFPLDEVQGSTKGHALLTGSILPPFTVALFPQVFFFTSFFFPTPDRLVPSPSAFACTSIRPEMPMLPFPLGPNPPVCTFVPTSAMPLSVYPACLETRVPSLLPRKRFVHLGSRKSDPFKVIEFSGVPNHSIEALISHCRSLVRFLPFVQLRFSEEDSLDS